MFFHLFLEYTWYLIVILRKQMENAVIFFFHKSMVRQFLKKHSFLNIYTMKIQIFWDLAFSYLHMYPGKLLIQK